MIWWSKCFVEILPFNQYHNIPDRWRLRFIAESSTFVKVLLTRGHVKASKQNSSDWLFEQTARTARTEPRYEDKAQRCSLKQLAPVPLNRQDGQACHPPLPAASLAAAPGPLWLQLPVDGPAAPAPAK